MSRHFPTSGPGSWPNGPRQRRTLIAGAVLLSMAASGCASRSAPVRLIEPSRPQLQPPPPELMEARKPTLTQRLLQLSSGSPTKATAPSDN